ncbi:acyl-CoA dehydrogenase family protein [Frigidibacter sp. MR17.24]|uniref:acyl-CoA dehydrogenase family protein n=1 Tax=Frigidibacter sp. MR17.24 TaxID=3127345 RepID=UPI0030129ED7
MDFALGDEQQAIFDMARGFGQDRIAPHARAWEAAGTIPRELWPDLAELGLGGLYVAEEAGGSGLGRLDGTLVFEALSMACPATAAFLSIHNMCAGMIDRHGSPAQRADLLPRLCAMETVASYCLTEPGSGSDAAALRTRADRRDDGYSLTGTKAFISGGGYSDLYVAMVRTGGAGAGGISALLVPAGAPGLSFGGLEDKMGWRAQPTRSVIFDDCRLGADALLGDEGRGFVYAMEGLDGGRLNISACALGAAQGALDATLRYMRDRQAFGRSLTEFQALQFRLAEMETRLQAARIFLRQAAWKLDTRAPDATKACAMAKLFVTDAAFDIANQCLQLHGGYGYLADFGIEKLVRDLRVHQILEGTNEIMRLIVSRELLKEAA